MPDISLLAPIGLFALLALPVIVVLHMRRTTPRPLTVPSLRFWLVAEPAQTRRTRWRRPPFSWLLLLQLLAAAALAVALARPATSRALDALGIDLRTDPRHLLLLLDGSTSMSATGPDGRTRFEAARAEALDRLAGLQEGDAATVLLMGTQVTTLGATDAASLDLLRERVATLPLPGGQADLDGALALAADLVLPGRENDAVVVSDGAVAADPATVAALGAPVAFAAVGGDAANAAVVAVTARTDPAAPDAPLLYARVANFGPDSVNAPAVLLADGLEAGRQDVALPANGSAELGWRLPPGASEATVRLEHPDALPADNAATLPLAGSDALSLRILLVSDIPSPLARVLAAIPGARLQSEAGDRLEDPAPLGGFDLVVLEGVVAPPEALARLQTPLLVVAPPAGGPVPVEGTMAAPEIERLRAGDPLLDGVDLAGAAFGDAPLLAPLAGREEVVGAAEGPLVARETVAGQPAVVFAFDPIASNLPRRVAFPILVANAVSELAPPPLPATSPLGEPLTISPRAGVAVVEVAPPTGEAVALPVPAPASGGSRPEVLFAATGAPGAYRVTERDANGAETGSGRFVVNAGHPRESDLRPNPGLPAALAEGRANAPAAGAPESALSQLWPLLALLALGLLALEWIVSLWPRRAPAPGTAASGASTPGMPAPGATAGVAAPAAKGGAQ
jgi:hypothetical protein